MQRIRWTGDRKTLYTVSLAAVVLLLLVLFLPLPQKRWIGAIALAALTALTLWSVKKKTAPSIHKRQVLLLMAVIGLLYTVILYLLGLYFGFASSPTVLSFYTLLWYILPITVLVICSELLRTRLLAGQDHIARVAAFVCCVVAELLCFLAIDAPMTSARLMDLLGLIFFPACISNFTYHYLAARYGAYPNIAYRLILSLTPHLIPYTPDVPDALLAFARLLAPLLVYLFLRALYEKKRRRAKQRSPVPFCISAALCLAFMLFVVILVSGRFRFGAIVIASESMSGEINKGDVIVYERFEDQLVKKDQVLVFDRNGTLTVHRVIDIERINAQNRYYTKGDANQDADAGFVTDGQIVGITKFKISYIGYASIWLNSLLAE